jgi:hypothetical protein
LNTADENLDLHKWESNIIISKYPECWAVQIASGVG